MTVEFLERFSKDLDHLKDSKVKSALKKVIFRMEEAGSLSELSNLKKLKGHETAFRMRIGE